MSLMQIYEMVYGIFAGSNSTQVQKQQNKSGPTTLLYAHHYKDG